MKAIYAFFLFLGLIQTGYSQLEIGVFFTGPMKGEMIKGKYGGSSFLITGTENHNSFFNIFGKDSTELRNLIDDLSVELKRKGRRRFVGLDLKIPFKGGQKYLIFRRNPSRKSKGAFSIEWSNNPLFALERPRYFDTLNNNNESRLPKPNVSLKLNGKTLTSAEILAAGLRPGLTMPVEFQTEFLPFTDSLKGVYILIDRVEVLFVHNQNQPVRRNEYGGPVAALLIELPLEFNFNSESIIYFKIRYLYKRDDEVVDSDMLVHQVNF